MPEEKDPAALLPTAEHVFAARFPGHCDIGHDTIEPGDLIRGHSGNGYVHAACYEGLPDSGAQSLDQSVDRPLGAVLPTVLPGASHVRRMWGVRLMPAYALDKVTLPGGRA